MARWMIMLVAAIAVVYVATVLIAGDPEFLIPGGILLVLVVGYAVAERLLTRAHLRRHHGDAGEAMRDDDDWAIPSAHLIPDDQRPTGDTPEVHDEINPHDLPIDHPGRRAAEEQAGQAGATTGNEHGAAGGRFERTTDRTDERTGGPQRSADHAKTAGGGDGPPGTSAGHAVEDRPPS